jgi:hypothetical protein
LGSPRRPKDRMKTRWFCGFLQWTRKVRCPNLMLVSHQILGQDQYEADINISSVMLRAIWIWAWYCLHWYKPGRILDIYQLIYTSVVWFSPFKTIVQIPIKYISHLFKRRRICISKKSEIYYTIQLHIILLNFFLMVMNMLVFNFFKNDGYAPRLCISIFWFYCLQKNLQQRT